MSNQLEEEEVNQAAQYDTFLYNGFRFKKSTYDFERVSKVLPNLEMRDTDILIASYPKTGTNWMKYIVTLLNSDGDFGAVEKKCLVEHVEFFELPNHFYSGALPETNEEVAERWKNTQGTRLFNTHFHWKLMPPGVHQGKSKVILVVRNPKDVIISMYKFVTSMKFLLPFEGSLEEFFTCFMRGDLSYGGGTYPEFYKSWWEQRNNVPMLIVLYEDIKRHPVQEIRRLAKFLGKTVSDQMVDEIARLSCIDNMRKSQSTRTFDEVLMDKTKSSFFRKGIVGDWKNVLSVAQSEAIDSWIEKEMEGTDFVIKYE